MEKEKLSSTEDDEYKEKSLKEKLKDLEELKKYCLEEWNKIEPKKYFKDFEAKIKLCKQINGERLNEFNLKEIRKIKGEKIEKEKEIQTERKFKRVFNENVLLKLKKKEIKELEKKKKDLPDYYDKKIKEKEEEIKDEKNWKK